MTTSNTSTGFNFNTGTSLFGSTTQAAGGFTTGGQKGTSNTTNSLWPSTTGRSSTPSVEHVATLTADPLFNRVWNLRCAYTPDSPAYRFCFVFYNKKINNTVPTCPNNIPEADWIKICTESPDPDHLVPCPVFGFEGLKERSESQKKVSAQIQERIDMYKAKLKEMNTFYATELQGSFEKIKQNAYTTNQLLMKFVESEDQNNQFGKIENEMKMTLEKLRLEEDTQRSLISKLQTKAKSMQDNRSSMQTAIEKNSLMPIVTALKLHQDAIMALEKLVKNLQKEVSGLESDMIDKTLH
ncbi:carbohydratebinding protein [Histomonas meleagridis]|uniref:carbohydratebinding protein n=1 Tax=Histomonas meleagridis TaxID=135588 RepID=UPI003559B8B8|nr:carbohydratebinding protein [Histomonas meleagridis]KAH0798059.1 carbohydratebinding protein [Histomonas meleagridis]